MECNKEEALKAKEIAEKKFTGLDINGAKRFALKAQNLYPELDGIPQFLAILDVYIAAEKRTNGEVDWYRILGVDPLADGATIRKQYRRLALIVHPDRNKSVGADGAFKLVSEAWTLLSDKGRRTLYDQKRNLRSIYEQVSDGRSSISTGQNGFPNLFNSNNSNGRYHQRPAYYWPPPAPSQESRPTFWTMCIDCKMQFEYLRRFINHNLVCANCHKPFLAFETPPPPLKGNASSTLWNSYQRRQNSSPQTVMNNSYPPGRTPASTTNVGLAGLSGIGSSERNFRAGIFSAAGGVESTPAATFSAAQAAGTLRPAFERLKRRLEEASIDGKREENHKIKSHDFKVAGGGLTSGSSGAGSSSVLRRDKPQKRRRANGHETATQMGTGNGGVFKETIFGSQKGSFGAKRMNIAGNGRVNCTRELSQLEMRTILIVKAKKEIRKKLNEWGIDGVFKTQYKVEEREKEKAKEKTANPGVKADMSKYQELLDAKKEEYARKCAPVKSDVDSDTKGPVPVSMSVPDPDFHDFDGDRTEKSFRSNEVWAAYDEDDGMPRYYAMIHSVISLDPFKMRISWLNSKSNDELAPLNWIVSGFPKTSGDFRVGKHAVSRCLNSFSHKVKWTKGIRGTIKIYPAKGDIWALYRNWSPDWNALTPDEVIHKYDMVEVLEDYNEERGVNVAPLIKVAGFKTLFRKHPDPSKIRTIPREEMFRFSHQVPSYFFTGLEAHSPPKDCWELDPASTPLELLQVIAEANVEAMETTAKAKIENPLECLKNPTIEEVMNNGREAIQRGNETKEKNLLVYSRRRLREGKRL